MGSKQAKANAALAGSQRRRCWLRYGINGLIAVIAYFFVQGRGF